MNVKSGDVVSVTSKDNKILNVLTEASVAQQMVQFHLL